MQLLNDPGNPNNTVVKACVQSNRRIDHWTSLNNILPTLPCSQLLVIILGDTFFRDSLAILRVGFVYVRGRVKVGAMCYGQFGV